jgi:hypothetical protein
LDFFPVTFTGCDHGTVADFEQLFADGHVRVQVASGAEGREKNSAGGHIWAFPLKLRLGVYFGGGKTISGENR